MAWRLCAVALVAVLVAHSTVEAAEPAQESAVAEGDGPNEDTQAAGRGQQDPANAASEDPEAAQGGKGGKGGAEAEQDPSADPLQAPPQEPSNQPKESDPTADPSADPAEAKQNENPDGEDTEGSKETLDRMKSKQDPSADPSAPPQEASNQPKESDPTADPSADPAEAKQKENPDGEDTEGSKETLDRMKSDERLETDQPDQPVDQPTNASETKTGYTGEQHRAMVERMGQAEARLQVEAAKTIIKDAQSKAADIVSMARTKAAAITNSAKNTARASTADAVEKVNEKAHSLLSKAKTIEREAEVNGEKARSAALTAEQAKQDSKDRAANAKSELNKARQTKIFARAKAAEESEITQKKDTGLALAKALAKKEQEAAQVKGDALNQEIAKEKELQGNLKAAQEKLKGEEAEAEVDRKRARTMVAKAEKAQSDIQVAARQAIRKAVKNAAILALAEKTKSNEAESNERSGKDIGSANTLAAQAQTAAEERMAKSDIAKARSEMRKVREEKKRALADVRTEAEKAGAAAKATPDHNDAKNAALKAEITHLHRQLKEANENSAGEILLSAMYNALPYESACGSLANDPAKMATEQARSTGECAAKCASKSACQSFQFTSNSCVLSKKKIVKNSKYGKLMACAKRNVLVKASMKIGGTVFEKKAKEELEELDLIEIAEEPQSEKEQAWTGAMSGKKSSTDPDKSDEEQITDPNKSDEEQSTDPNIQPQSNKEKSTDPNLPSDSVSPAGRTTQLVTKNSASKLESKLISVQQELASCTASMQSQSSGSPAAVAAAAAAAAAAANATAPAAPAAPSDADAQKAIKAAVEKAKAETHDADVREKVMSLTKVMNDAKAEAEKNADAKIKSKVGADEASANAKLEKGARDEAIAKEALKKALSVSDAEKAEFRQNKDLAAKLGHEKTELLVNQKEKEAYSGELQETKAADKSMLDKEKAKVSALESREISASAKKDELEDELQDSQAVKKKLVGAAKEMAVGMRLKEREITHLHKEIRGHNNQHEDHKYRIRKLMSKVQKANIKLASQAKKFGKEMRTARSKYETSIGKMRDTMNGHLTQAELAKRALQLCEMKERGSGARAADRVARRENRAVKRAERKTGEKDAQRNLKKSLAAKLEAKIGEKLKKKEAADVAAKVKKLTHKDLSPKCAACAKLDSAERTMVGADCKAC